MTVIDWLATEKHPSFHIMRSLQRPMTLIGGVTMAVTNIVKLDGGAERG